ncbi:MAG: hypothetical protein Q8J59_12155 [Methylotenera sp.]|nr:hypothetical protein [Methylotenera sp.]
MFVEHLRRKAESAGGKLIDLHNNVNEPLIIGDWIQLRAIF